MYTNSVATSGLDGTEEFIMSAQFHLNSFVSNSSKYVSSWWIARVVKFIMFDLEKENEWLLKFFDNRHVYSFFSLVSKKIFLLHSVWLATKGRIYSKRQKFSYSWNVKIEGEMFPVLSIFNYMQLYIICELARNQFAHYSTFYEFHHFII